MSNLYIKDNLIKYDIYNVSCERIGLNGHFVIQFDLKTKEMLIKKFATFGGLTYIITQDHPIVEPTDNQRDFILDVISRRTGIDLTDDHEIAIYPKRNITDWGWTYVFNGEDVNWWNE